jgi:hypothetical protein
MTGNGYILKVGSNVFPNSLIAKKGYSNTPDRRQDKNSYTDTRGVTHRNILPVKRTTSKITTIPLTYGQKLIVQAFFPNRDHVEAERWNDEKNAYETGVCYIPDVEYVIDTIDRGGNFYYDPIEIEFIAYGE